MDAKKEIIKKVIMSRRLLNTVKICKETGLCSEEVLQLQTNYLELLKQLQTLNTVKISLTSERLTWKHVSSY